MDLLFAYWNGRDDAYQTRVIALRNGVLLPALPRLNSISVTNDSFVDALKGGDDLDWYFGKMASPAADMFIDFDPLEEKN